jgi:hypothetical protein
MQKYTAMIKKMRIISVFADSMEDAERIIGIHLRGRPGRHDLYVRWVNGGKEIIDPNEGTTTIKIA